MGMVTMDHTYEVHQIKTYHQMWSNYCYIIADRARNSAIAVDPSWEIGKITDKLHELDVDLSAVLLTHSHYDHVNLAEPLQQIYHSDIYMSSAEIDFYQFRCRNLIGLEDGQTFAAGGFIIKSILTPGHTAGGMCYLLSDHLFTGDTVFQRVAVYVRTGAARRRICLTVYSGSKPPFRRMCVYIRGTLSGRSRGKKWRVF